MFYVIKYLTLFVFSWIHCNCHHLALAFVDTGDEFKQIFEFETMGYTFITLRKKGDWVRSKMLLQIQIADRWRCQIKGSGEVWSHACWRFTCMLTFYMQVFCVNITGICACFFSWGLHKNLSLISANILLLLSLPWVFFLIKNNS